MEIISMKCPNCGASISTSQKKCEYCRADVMVQSFHAMSSMPLPQVNKYLATYKTTASEHPDHNGVNASIGMCFLRLKKYDQAISFFEKAQADNFEDATPFFYAAVARLKGRKPFLCSRQEIDAIEADINAAISIEPKAEHYYFLSYIGRDYYRRKFIKHEPTCEELYQEAINNGFSVTDVEEFHNMSGTPIDIPL